MRGYDAIIIQGLTMIHLTQVFIIEPSSNTVLDEDHRHQLNDRKREWDEIS